MEAREFFKKKFRNTASVIVAWEKEIAEMMDEYHVHLLEEKAKDEKSKNIQHPDLDRS